MALINCSECGAEVSSNAPACPKCGNPIAAHPATAAAAPPPKPKANVWRRIVRTIALIFVGLVIMIIWAANHTDTSNRAEPNSSPSVSDASSAAPTPEPPIEVSADELYAAYKANEVSADAKYKGHILKVSGIVGSISKDVMDDPYITLVTTENEFETVNAYFGKSALQQLSELKKGQAVTVTCKGNGMVMMSPLLDCK